MHYHVDPMVVQTGLAVPLLLALIAKTARQRERGPVHRYLFWVLLLILSWTLGLTLDPHGSVSRAWVAALVAPPSAFMAPLFLLIVLHLAHVEWFENRRGATALVLAPFWFFLAAFWTHDWHGWMAPVTVRAGADGSTGPLFWAFQLWSNAAAIAGIGLCIWTAATSESWIARRRMWLLGSAAFVPMVTHAVYTFRLAPLDFPLTPTALAVTSLLLVAAIGRFRLLEVQPIVRRDVVEASSDGVLVAGADELVVDLNPAACRLLGAEASELRGLALGDVLASLGRMEPRDVLPSMLETLRAGREPARVEVETEDGRVLEFSAGMPREVGGVRAGYFIVIRDRSSERRAQKLAQQSQRLESVGILAAGVAHEVNNPLAYVRANLAYLEEIAANVEGQLEDLPKDVSDGMREMPEVILETVAGLDRIHGIVQGLLRLSRMPDSERVHCCLNDVIGEAVHFVGLDRSAAPLIEQRLAEALPPVRASRDQLVQVLLNLLLNARHALVDSPDPRIELRTAVLDGWVELRVSDNGPGVPESIRGKIFDPFFTTRAPDQGTGLGLAIAFDIIRDHDGVLELETSPRGGACFVARLPLASGHAGPAPVDLTQGSGAAPRGA